MNKLKRVLACLLILAGSFLEILYIYYRYKSDGIFLPVCIIIGVGLNIFLMLAVYEKRKGLAAALIFFSILNTTSGQTLSMLKMENTEKKTVIADESGNQIARYKKDIAQLDTEIQAINKRLNGFATMEEKAEYKNNVREDEAALEKKRIEKARLETLITDTAKVIKEDAEDSVKATSVYTFYGSIPRWKLKDWITFILHTILSFFISIMAPFGIATLEKVTKEEREAKESEVAQVSDNSYTLEDWVRWMWRGERLKKPVMSSLYAMEEFAYISAKKWDAEKHTAYMDKAIRLQLIDAKGNLVVKVDEALEKMKKDNE